MTEVMAVRKQGSPMGQAGNALLAGADPVQVADELDSLFCHHMIAAYGQVLEHTKGDELTRVVLLKLLRFEVARESDLEGAGAR
ncbi:hypothetical protein [Nonomuraea sp. NEAU-A123]|uniref:hypothetical protein n=1 Tax=Nonomuraea sp. NEAU-A123 TaxID=2839649 RepID=UPI001BE4DA4D|nr:hypothetical protein [Nonomuraea sp. NEAU-A123]MBT2235755.1 hypothetical protein [Nonomuraea sp. NEAU-A123]